MIDHSHRGFDATREQMIDVIKGKKNLFRNNTLNECMLNTKKIENNPK